MENLCIKENDKVLVRGATSGVGIAFLKLLKGLNKNILVSGSCRNPNKFSALTTCGFDDVIEDRDGVLQTFEKFDKVLELVGSATLRDTFSHVNDGGIVCSTGQLGGEWYLNEFDPITELPANGYLTSFYSANVSGDRLQNMIDFIENNRVDVSPEKVFSLEQVPLAHEYLEGKTSFGKVVVVK